ncbi:MAG: hypothetical protein HY893_01360 [Deltaproteobacteria bacterium]|nr:hypothetical protein [Deltaproteobacteria bacterium]
MRDIGSRITAAAFLSVFIALFIFAQPSSAVDITSHNLNISVDIKGRKITGTDRITPGKQAKLGLYIRQGSSIDRVLMDGKDLKFSVLGVRTGVNALNIDAPEDLAGKTLEVHFHGSFQSPAEAAESVKRGVAFVEDGVIGEEGVFLPSGSFWFPQEEKSLALFECTVALPAGYTAVMEGSSQKGGKGTERWKAETPLDGFDLVAGRYIVTQEDYKGIGIYTYFFKDEKELSRTYISKTKGYLDLYQGLIGPYPFKKFAVVENFLPTGYGMPSFTLLGSSVIRLPFIPDTSLGHEIAHSWWGNSVFVDDSLGNWVEALTTYTADYLYERNKGEKEAREFRLNKLRGYKNFAQDGEALKDFIDSTTPSSRAVGYNKGMMVFGMLEDAIGREPFEKGLKDFYRDFAFRRASWKDLREAFEKASDSTLGWFFDQWINRSGGPSLMPGSARAIKKGDIYEASFTIKQIKPAYILDLPVLFKTENGEVLKKVRVKDEAEEVKVELASRPVSVEIDPGYEVFRILSDEEMPPSLGACLGDRNGVIVTPGKGDARQKYLAASEQLSKDYNLELVTDAMAGVQDYLKYRSVFILGAGGENAFYLLAAQHFSRHASITGDTFRVNGKAFGRDGSAFALAVKNPENPAKTICLFASGLDKEKTFSSAKRMRYFSDSSYVVFSGDKVDKGIFEGKKLQVDFQK